MAGGNFVKLGERRNMLEFFAQHLAVWKSFRICHETRSHGPNGLIFGSPFLDSEPTVPPNQFPFLGETGRNEMFARGKIMFNLTENPR